MVQVCIVIICLHGNLSSHFELYSCTDSLINTLNCVGIIVRIFFRAV